jgi:hypothetical protein
VNFHPTSHSFLLKVIASRCGMNPFGFFELEGNHDISHFQKENSNIQEE